MSSAAPPLTDTTRGDAPARLQFGEGWAGELLERQLRMLMRLADSGLRLAEAAEREALLQIEAAGGNQDPAGEAPAPEAADWLAAHAKAARCVRLTLMLQAKLADDLRELDRQARLGASFAGSPRETHRSGRERLRKTAVQDIVGRIAEAEHDDDNAVERLVAEAGERLDREALHGDLLSRPVSELVALICEDLGLECDWPGLAQEAQARDEPGSGPPGAPLAARNTPPLPEHQQLAAAMASTRHLIPRAASP